MLCCSVVCEVVNLQDPYRVALSHVSEKHILDACPCVRDEPYGFLGGLGDDFSDPPPAPGRDEARAALELVDPAPAPAPDVLEEVVLRGREGSISSTCSRWYLLPKVQ